MATAFKLPDVGEGIESGTVVGILVSVGDTVEKDQPVLELETDKAVVEVPSSVSGVVQEIHVKENDEAKVGQVILSVAEEGEGDSAEGDQAEAQDADEQGEGEEAQAQGEGEEVEATEQEEARTDKADAKAEDDQAKESAKPKDKKTERDTKQDTEQAATTDKTTEAQQAPDAYEGPDDVSAHVPAAPSVRRLAREMGVDIRQISGSGMMGRISAEDVKRHAEGGGTAVSSGPQQPSQAPPKLPDFGKYGEYERVPMSSVRRATARQMSLAWSQVPHVTQVDKADITDLERLRKTYAKRVEAAGGGKLTPTAIIIRVVAAALRMFPEFNASIDVAENEIVLKHYVHIGVAVDTERGLLVPVIRHVDKKNIVEISKDLNELAERARNRKTSMDEMQGATFTVTNLGGIGGTSFTPIVNFPEVAILGVSRGTMEPVYIDGEFRPRLMMPLSLSYDHRLIDGASAARFLRWVCEALEQPFLLALEG